MEQHRPPTDQAASLLLLLQKPLSQQPVSFLSNLSNIVLAKTYPTSHQIADMIYFVKVFTSTTANARHLLPL